MSQSQTAFQDVSGLTRLQEAFKSADKDNDDLLNKEEFSKFVEIGYRKECPPGMYQSVCTQFKSDPNVGINWNTAKELYLKAMKRKSTKKPEIKSQNSRSSDSFIRRHSLSPSSDMDPTLPSPQYKLSKRVSLQDLYQNDTSSMIVDILNNKNKSLQNKLLYQRTKLKKTEDIAQSLLYQNDEYKLGMTKLTADNKQLLTENNALTNEASKLQTCVINDRNNLKHLKEEKSKMQTEIDEAYNLWAKIEKEHNTKLQKLKKEHSLKIQKLKAQHKSDYEQLCNGFLESLGAEPGKGSKDIGSIIKELKCDNAQLQNTVDTLAESLARKQQSLLEALQAIEQLNKTESMNDMEQMQMGQLQLQRVHSEPKSKNTKRIRNKLRQWNQRRKSFSLHRKHSVQRSESVASMAESEFVGVSDTIMDSEFFKNVNEGKEAKLSIDTAKNVKEMQFLSQQLTYDVMGKRQSIQNLEMANTVLFEQMQKMNKQMNEMKNEKSKYDLIKNESNNNRINDFVSVTESNNEIIKD